MLATDTYVIVLRILHVMGGIAWGGAIFVFVFFLQPTASVLGPAAGPFMGELLGKRKIVNVVLWIAATTIVAGLLLYWEDWRQFTSFGDFVGGAFGLWLTIGAVSAIVAFLIGLFGTKPTIDRVLTLGAQIAAAGESPPPERVAQLQALQARGRTLALTNFAFVAIAAFAMSTARYW